MGGTALGIINAGLGIISVAPIRSITPPSSAVERSLAEDQGYAAWKRQELTVRRWVCATDTLTLALAETVQGSSLPYRYHVPGDVLRIIREKNSEWQQKRQLIWSRQPSLAVDAILNVPEGELDDLFCAVLSARVAKEMAGKADKPEAAYQRARAAYAEALNTAGRTNAFVIGPEDTKTLDEDDDMIVSRLYPGVY